MDPSSPAEHLPRDPRRTHTFDQARAAIDDLADLVAHYYFALRRRGIPASQASILAGSFQQSTLNRRLSDEEQPERPGS